MDSISGCLEDPRDIILINLHSDINLSLFHIFYQLSLGYPTGISRVNDIPVRKVDKIFPNIYCSWTRELAFRQRDKWSKLQSRSREKSNGSGAAAEPRR